MLSIEEYLNFRNYSWEPKTKTLAVGSILNAKSSVDVVPTQRTLADDIPALDTAAHVSTRKENRPRLKCK